MQLLDASVRVFVEALTTRPDLRDSVEPLAQEMLEVARHTGPAGLNHAVGILVQALPLPFEDEAHVAIVLGALVELGADPLGPAPAFAAMLSRVFRAAQSFVAACEDTVEQRGLEEVTPGVRKLVSSSMPSEAAAHRSLNNICLGAMASLTRSAEAREIARGQPRLELRARALAPVYRAARLVWVLLSVLEEEELLVLDPARALGWRVRIGGVADNRQLYLLLAGVLPGDHPRPSAEALTAATDGLGAEQPISVQNAWTFFQWQALRPDGSLPKDPAGVDPTQDVVSCLGVPAQIESLDGVRTLLIGPALEQKTWHASRLFHELHARIELIEVLPSEVAKAHLAQIAQAKQQA